MTDIMTIFDGRQIATHMRNAVHRNPFLSLLPLESRTMAREEAVAVDTTPLPNTSG